MFGLCLMSVIFWLYLDDILDNFNSRDTKLGKTNFVSINFMPARVLLPKISSFHCKLINLNNHPVYKVEIDMKLVYLFLGLIVLIIIAVLVIRTAIYPFNNQEVKIITVEKKSQFESPPSILALKRLSGGIRIPTISREDNKQTDFKVFDHFVSYLKEQYPAVFKNTEFDTINQYGLVFHWKGKSSTLPPKLFLSHYDVVPVAGYSPADTDDEVVFRPNDKVLPPIESTQKKWDFPPFSGAVANGRIYGRGTLDMKGMLFSIMEAADSLISENFVPDRDIWFAFGPDEEVGGLEGAVLIAKYFKEKNITFDSVYDEGGIVASSGSVIQSAKKPMALVGMGEKGFLTIRIKVFGQGGHSSMPPKKSPLVYAAEIIKKLNDNQMPARLIPPINSFFNNIGGDMGYFSKLAIANKWLLKKPLMSSLKEQPASNALIRTTTAITMAKGSDAPNVIASFAEITVNFRILQGDTVKDTMTHVEELCKGHNVEISIESLREPSELSPEESYQFQFVSHTINKIYPEAIVSPYITIGGTDAYKYQIVSKNIFRFMPIELNSYEQQTIHNENEHISIRNYGNMIQFFTDLMRIN